MRNKIFIAVGMLCLFTSCVKGLDDYNAIPTPGAEVAFVAGVGAPETKTVYGSPNADGTGLQVKWVHDDKITVYGTTCSVVPQADYAVKTYKKVNGNLTDEILPSTPNTNTDGQSYADDLVKTGAAGVQWGSEPKSDFYAVYPATSGKFTPTATGVTVPAKISAQQYNSFSVVGGVLAGTPYHAKDRTYGMDDAIMYAYTKDGKPTDEAGNPITVDLNFKPFSTVLKFHIASWEPATGSGLQTDMTGKSIRVNSITLQAPYNIAGDFTLTLNGSTASAEEGTTNKISIIPSEEIVWTYGQALEFGVFVIPVSEQNISGDWKVTITANDGSRTFSLKPKSTSNDIAKIKPGKIHQLNVAGFPVSATWEYNPATWLTTVPRNVYISDISLPGAWYATDSGYQGGTLAQQYAAGIRAFNIDCRLSIKEGQNAKGSYTESDYNILNLVCAGTEVEEVRLGFITTGKLSDEGKHVKEAIKELGTLIANSTNAEEYIEVVLTVAQKPKTRSSTTYGTIDPKMVLRAIVDVLNDDEGEDAVKGFLYGANEGEEITPNTTLGEVAGRVVVKVNMNTTAANIRTWNYSAPMLISEASMAPEASGTISKGNFTSMNSSEMYWSNNYITDPANLGYMQYHYHQCQNTTGSNNNASVDNRKTAISDVLSKSYEIYNDNTHNSMFQLGIGGWTSDNDSGKTNLSGQLNPYVYGIVNSMLTGTEYGGKVYTPAPVGAVLMNFATSTSNSTKDLIKAIIDLNGKYFLNRDTTKPAWPSENGGDDEGGQDDPNEDDGSGGGSEGDQGEV